MENTTENTTMTETTDITNSNENQSLVDRQVAIARARLAAKLANGQTGETAPVVERRPVVKRATAETTPEELAAREADKARRDEERAAAKLVRDQERVARQVEREAARAAKLAEREANARPAHMSKVEKAGSRLPPMDMHTQCAYDGVTTVNLNEGQIAVLCAHLSHLSRVKATMRSKSVELIEGQTVEIVSSDRDARLIGLRGTIAQVRKIRVLVDIPGHTRQAYLFCSDVVPVAEEQNEVSEPVTESVVAEDEYTEEVVTAESTGTDDE